MIKHTTLSVQYRTILFVLMFNISTQGNAADVVQLPPVNLGETAFLDGIAFPGLFLQINGGHFHGDSFNDSDGDALPGNNEIDVNSLLLQYAYITRHKILGGYYGAEVLLPVADIEPDTSLPGLPSTGESGVGDLIVSPLFLQWTDSELFGKSYFHRLNFLVVLPTGNYSAANEVNIGSNIYRFNPYYAGTLLLTPKLATSFRMHYLWNSENTNPDIRLGVDDIQAGSAFHINYAASYQVMPKLRIGLAGYYLQQLNDDKINGISQANSQERVFSIGPGLQYKHSGGLFDFNTYFEFGAENRPEGYRIVARYSWILP